MKKIVFFICALFIVSVVQADVLDTLKARVMDDLMISVNTTNENTVTPLITSMAANGSWTDINYKSTEATKWDPLNHLDRLLKMSCIYLKSGQSLYLSPALLTKIEAGLNYWYLVKPTSTNWWNGTIGIQQSLNKIGLLMKGRINSTILTKVINDLSAAPSKTGANLTDISTSVIYRGLIEGNLTRVKSGLTAIANEIKITTAEGLQIDYSFHQHGAMLYNGGYGFVFLESTTYWCEKSGGTTLAFAPSKIGMLSGMLLQGNRWMVRGNTQDYGATERGISRPVANSGSSNIKFARRMANVDNLNSNALTVMADRIDVSGIQDISGNKHFWKSDFSAHQRSKFYTSVKMCSKRTIGIECMNDENLKGYWLPYGVNFTFRTGNEYTNIFPVWDWALLPGATNAYKTLKPTSTQTQTETFVGGVTDGTYGVSAMKLNTDQTTAKKAWFFFDNEIVALGAAITTTQKLDVNTTLNQSFLRGDLLVDGNVVAKGTYTYPSVNWVMNDSTAYIFLEKKPVVLKAKTQSGSWSSINAAGTKDVINNDVFTLCLPHGKAPTNASYQYVVLPGVSPAQAAAYAAKKPVVVLKNTADIQAVTQSDLNVTGIVFYKAGVLAINNSLSLSVDHSCIALVKKAANGDYSVCISDPEGTATKIVCTLTLKSEKKTLTLTMPTGDNKGKSICGSVHFTTAPAAEIATVSIAELPQQASLQLHVYPQPNEGIFTLSFTVAAPEEVTIQVYDTQGRVVYSERKSNFQGIYENALDISKYPSGNYFIHVKTGSRSAVMKTISIR